MVDHRLARGVPAHGLIDEAGRVLHVLDPGGQPLLAHVVPELHHG